MVVLTAGPGVIWFTPSGGARRGRCVLEAVADEAIGRAALAAAGTLRKPAWILSLAMPAAVDRRPAVGLTS
jgi:hypothetical protein